MKAIILAGGYGTRLQPLTLRTPKSLLPLGDSNGIMKIIKSLENTDVDEIIISINKNQEKVKEFLSSQKLNYKLRFIFEQTESDVDKLGAIGALVYITKKCGYDDYIVLGADNYFKGIKLSDLINQHKMNKADVTIAHYDLEDISKVSSFGVGVVNQNNKIIKFQEKPSIEKALSTLASTFLYYLSKEFVKKHLPDYVKKEINKGKKPDNIGDLWEHFCTKLNVYAFTFKGYWGDIGRPLGYIDANRRALDEINTKIDKNIKIASTSKISGKVIIEKNCEIENDVVIIGPCIIRKNVKIGRGSIVGPYTTILHDSVIGPYNIINGSIIFEKVSTKSNVKINRAIIDGNTIILNNTKVEEHTMIGFSCKINENSQILYNTKLWPLLSVDKGSMINGIIFYPKQYLNNLTNLKKSKYWK